MYAIGGYQEAKNVELLAEMGITHVLNCAAHRNSSRNPYPEWSGIIGYRQFDANDDVYYDIIQHVPAAKSFIDGARRQGGKVLVHCARGINRSGAICVAYMMVDSQQDLIETVQYVKRCRGLVLTNVGFRRQLIGFARKYGLLYSSDDERGHAQGHIQGQGQIQNHSRSSHNLNNQSFANDYGYECSQNINDECNGLKRSNLNVVLSLPKT